MGRNFGEGFIEATFDQQESINETLNNLNNKMRLASKTLLQSRDDIIEQNIFTDYDNGEIIKTENSDLKQIDMSVHDINNFLTLANFSINNIRLNTSGSEILFGDTMPSGTAYRLGSLMQQQGAKMFEFIRERLGVFISEIVKDWIIPDLLEKIKKEDTLYIKDPDDWNEIMEMYVNNEISDAVIKYAITNGKMPSDLEIESEKKKLLNKYTSGKDRILPKLRDDYFDFDYDIICNVTGENSNVQAETESLINLVNQIGANPGILENPATVELLNRIADNIGLDAESLQLGKKDYKQKIQSRETANNNPQLKVLQMGANAGATREGGRNQSIAGGGIENMQLNNL